MNIEPKKIDIISPVFNKKDEIVHFIASVIKLNKNDFNIILVDDGSTDGTLDVVTTLINGHSNIFIVKKENGGVSSARNCGLRLAKSQYVWFCDPDDEVISENIDYLMARLKYNYDCYIFNYKNYFYLDGIELICSYAFLGEYKFSKIKDQFLNERVNASKKQSFLFTPWDKIYKRAKIISYFDENLTVYEDQLFNFNYFFDNEGVDIIDFISQPLYLYKTYANFSTLSQDWNSKKTEDFFYFCKTLSEKYKIDISGIVCKEANHILHYTIGFKNKITVYYLLKKKTNTKLFDIKYFRNELLSYLLISNLYYMLRKFKNILKGK